MRRCFANAESAEVRTSRNTGYATGTPISRHASGSSAWVAQRLVIDTAEAVPTNLRKIMNALDLDLPDSTGTVAADGVDERKTEKS